MSTQQITRTERTPQTSNGEPGDHERFSHYVEKGKIAEALVEGTPVRALCGKIWVPNRDPKNFPVCPECKEIYDGMADDITPSDG